MSAVVENVAELNAAAPGSVVITAATDRFPGFEYVKRDNGNWWMKRAVNTPPATLLDPQHSAQPITWVERR